MFLENERAAESRIVVRIPLASERLISLRGQPPMLGERCTNSTELLRLRESTDDQMRTLRLRETAQPLLARRVRRKLWRGP
jgi:hypothetical protein